MASFSLWARTRGNPKERGFALPEYELIYVVKPDLEDDELEGVIGRVAQAISSQKGKIAHENRWGLRDLAYSIEGVDKGYYVLAHLELPGSAVAGLEQNLILWEEILRHLIVRRDGGNVVEDGEA
ncbi:MAG: 30S ribosomal protein S6 [Anaerolineae bacterium]